MNFIVKIVIFVFIIFLSAPTIVSLIEKNTNISFYYNNSELEEMHKEIKLEFKSEFKYDTFSLLYFNQPKKSSLILSENLSKHDNISSSIFIPPPDFI